MKKTVRILALMMALLMISTVLLSCGKGNEEGGGSETGGSIIGGDAEAAELYKDVDFGGKKLIVHTNTDDIAEYESSSRYVMAAADLSEATGAVEEAVYKRDIWLKENLHMEIEYITCNVSYGSVVETLEPLLLSGDGNIDLYINKLYPMASLSLRGYFANIANRPEINYYENYWYTDVMNSLSLDDGNSAYLLAGDYFMDVIQSTNVMMANTSILDEYFGAEGGSEAFLTMVVDGQWTYEKMYEYINTVHGSIMDIDRDTYGYAVSQVWGPMIPMITSADLDYVEFSGGTLTSALNNARANDIYDWMCKIFTAQGTAPFTQKNDTEYELSTTEKEAYNIFTAGRAMITSGRFGQMSKLAAVDIEYSVLPYPKLSETDSYVTPLHDTTEIGAVAASCKDVSTVLQMLEILCERTNKTVMVKYYDDGLKLKYSANTTVSEIVDIIHDSVGSAFALAYNKQCANALLWEAFYIPYLNNQQNFATNYARISSSLNSALKDMSKQWNAIEQ